MMLHFDYLKNEIRFENSCVQLLVIENKELFRNVILAFSQENTESMFVFSKDFVPFEFSKQGFFIVNPLTVDWQNKKLMTKINAFLSNAANNDFGQEFAQIKSQLMEFAEKLGTFSDFDFEWCDDIDAASVIKLLQFKSNSCSQSLPEQFVTYILLINKYLQTNLFVAANLHMYFSDVELAEIYKTVALHHINLLVIEPSIPLKTNRLEQVHIVDKDLCDIDNEIIR